MKKLVFPSELHGVILSTELHDFIQKSAKYVQIDKKTQIDANILLYTILADENENLVTSILDAMKVDLNILFEMLKENRVNNESNDEADSITLSQELTKILSSSYKKIIKTKNIYETVDFVFALLKTKNQLTNILNENAIEYLVFKQTYDEINEFYDKEFDEEDEGQDMPINIEMPLRADIKKTANSQKSVIEKFTTNLNVEYEKGNIGECIGREDEIETLERVLGRTNKKNCILIGKAGVGKTQIVEGLVKKICDNAVAPHLQNKTILALSINDLESGTSWRGQLEERIKALVTYLTENENVILFIDEIHSMVGVGRSINADLTNALKPFLTKGKIQIIGATTLDEYKTYIEDKKAFTRRFFIQHVEELDKEATLEILKRTKAKYEEYHGVKYSNAILSEIVTFCDKYLKNRTFPDKAIDIMDDLGATVKVGRKLSKDLVQINKKINDLKLTKKYIIQNKKYESSEDILLSEKELKTELNKLLEKSESKTKQLISKEVFLNYLDKSHGIKDYYGDNFESQIDYCEMQIKKVMFGQDQAIASVLEQMKIKRLFDDYTSPLVLFFVGRSGVGKTFLAELLAKHLYQNKLKVVLGEMFKEKHSVSNFVGSPKGYVDSDKGSDVFEYVKYNPESVLVFDEIEKAHPDFYDILLNILDKGLITDKNGDTIDFRRCLMIFTSNIGVDAVKTPTIGYTNHAPTVQSIHEKATHKAFKPAFLDRIDEFIYFEDINNYEEILDLELEKMQTALKSKNIELKLSEETKSQILKEIQMDKEGAIRTLRRSIAKNIKGKITQQYKVKKALVI